MNPPTPETDSQPPVRLGCVSYLNTLPLIDGLGKWRGAKLTMTAPSLLIDLLEDHAVDAALVSAIDYQRSSMPLTILPVGMIGCEGPTLTVRVFSRTPLERVATLHTDVESHTSVTLARLLLAERSGVTPEAEPFDADAHRAALASGDASAWPETVLMIGDKVVTESPPAALYPHQLDLGAAWRELTGLPFVYAAWMCRAGREHDDPIAAACDVLVRQRLHNETRLGYIAARQAPVRGWPVDVARAYVGDMLRYDLDETALGSMREFFGRAHAAGLIPEIKPLRVATGPPSG